MNSFLTLHILADGCVEKDITRAGQFLAATGAEFYNITTCSRYDEAEKLIRILRAHAPSAKPLWRGYPSKALEDSGIWQRVTPQEWVNYRIAPNVTWLKELDVYVVTCNEVGVLGKDAVQFSNWEADCVKLSGTQFGVKLAILRFSTGNPLPSEIENYDSALKAASEHGAILSPNEYTGKRGEIVTGWHVGRYRGLWKRQDVLGIKRSRIVVGEYGIARINGDNSLDPFHGYDSEGVNIAEHISIIERDGEIYREDDVPAAWFVHGHWQEGKGSFDVHNNEPLLTAVEDEAKAGKLTTKKITRPFLEPVPRPTNARLPLHIYIKNASINVRSGPGTEYQDCGDLVKDQAATIFEPTQLASDASTRWSWVEYMSKGVKLGGWVSMGALKFTTNPPTVEAPVVVSPPAPPVQEPAPTVPEVDRDAEILKQLKVLRGALDALITLYTPRENLSQKPA